MKMTKLSVAILGAVGTFGLMTPAFVAADDPPPALQEKAAKQPFRGKVEALDASLSTFTVGGKVIYVAPDTKITKAGKTITLGDIAVGDEVHGMTRQTFDGKTEALTVTVAPQKDDKN
jgi:hypothetical protein